MRVLVADGDEAVRRVVIEVLQRCDTSEVTEASNGSDAIGHWGRGVFDLVVMDRDLPDRCGLDVVRAIRAEDPRIPILMVTARAQRSEVIEAIDAGVSDYLSKPVDMDALRQKLRRFCEHVDALKALRQRTGESTRVEYLNPFIASIIHVFDTMMRVKIVRQTPFLGKNCVPENEVSGIIGLTGRARGVAVVSLGRETAIRCAERLLGERPCSVNAEVRDTVGELANIVAGGAKAQMQQLELSVSLPTIIVGRNHLIDFPARLTPVCIPFQCDWGPVSLQVGLREQQEVPATAEVAALAAG